MQLQKILQDFTREASKIYGSHLVKIVLYGSYARGDFQDDSDIDLLVLVDVDEAVIKQKDNQILDAAYDIGYDAHVAIHPITLSVSHFRKWQSVHPFYKNICADGVEVYAHAG
ncbi:MAG: nucleotidyltransferase domain-containing protein [Selenomonas sp.]|jgi:predicted nucleotidyltransferase|nr:nucleotidyltransferase domain-containing protein [Selenomonas sp.]MDD6119524.1 nucleotidyltransferase domain-containing protein [Selenomonadaceae bacterium]MDD7056439.1 nucleotidyltransferase domain-containing protein [Selenomonadaceae bacterium]MDY3917070.1 nucleotidyltransferase domain-containing protein [Selenomonadaceae bacterium]HBT79498.1 DNA polymerase subunit beta [Selenomonas sp.]